MFPWQKPGTKPSRSGRPPAPREHYIPDFKTAAWIVYREREATFRNEVHKKHWIGQLEKFVISEIGTIRIDRITSADLLKVLSPIWLTSHEIAFIFRLLLESREYPHVREEVFRDAFARFVGKNLARYRTELSVLVQEHGDLRQWCLKRKSPPLFVKDIEGWTAFTRDIASSREQ